MGRAVILFATWVFFAGASPFSPAFAQLPDFLKPENLPSVDEPAPPFPRGESKPRSPKAKGPAPRITFARAAKILEPGEIWDIYLVLEDAEANLKSLEWELRQEGPGGISRGTIPLALPRTKAKVGQELFKEEEIGKLAGYLELDTGGPDVRRRPGRFDGLRMTLIVAAVDKEGHRSQKRTFPLVLRLGAPRPSRPVLPGVSLRHRIGAIAAVFPDPLGGKVK